MAWILDAELASLEVKIPSMCRRHLEVMVGNKKVCSVCNWHEDCDLVIGAIDVAPLSELIYYLRGFDLDNVLVRDLMKRVIEDVVTALGLSTLEFKVVRKINEDLPQFAPRDIWQVDENQLVFKSADLMRIGIYFAEGDEFDPDEFVAFNNLVRYALDTGSIKAILRFNGVDPYGPSDDYYWVIVYGQGTGGDGT